MPEAIPGARWLGTGQPTVIDAARFRAEGAWVLAQCALQARDAQGQSAAMRALWRLAGDLGIRAASLAPWFTRRVQHAHVGGVVAYVSMDPSTHALTPVAGAADRRKGTAPIVLVLDAAGGPLAGRVAQALAAAIAGGWEGELWFALSGLQLLAHRDRVAELERLTALAQEAVRWGVHQLCVDMSAVVPVTRRGAEEAQAEHATLVAEWASRLLRRRHRLPPCVDVQFPCGPDLESTEAAVLAFLDGVEDVLPGASWEGRGGLMTLTLGGGADGSPDPPSDAVLSTHRRLSALLRERYGMGGTMLFGAWEWPRATLDAVRASGIAGVRLPAFPSLPPAAGDAARETPHGRAGIVLATLGGASAGQALWPIDV